VKISAQILHFLIKFILLAGLSFLAACNMQKGGERSGVTVLVFKHGKIAGNPEPLRSLIARFERENPGIRIMDETLPASSDEQHQFFIINLEGKSVDFDVMSLDVIWVPEFARAGWLHDMGRLLPANERDEFFPGPMDAVTYEGKVWAVPWYIDAGVLYYRKDLLDRYGLKPPATWEELVSEAQRVTAGEKGLYGFVWQGKQYEGLVCDVLEYFRGNGGDVLRDGRVVIDSPANRRALGFMRNLIVRYHVSPPLVTTATEESTRHIFGNGRAVFMRNWPYAWNVFAREGSPVKGKVGVAPIPSFPGGRSSPTLGGWQLGVNRYSRHPEEAERFIRFMTSASSQKYMALTIGYKPTRKALYRDPELLSQQPFIAGLFGILMTARPRPVTAYYMMMTQVMQPEFSAALTGVRTPGEALENAQRQIEHIIGIEQSS
jgi:multiple sugar transport system substrate-binding protein